MNDPAPITRTSLLQAPLRDSPAIERAQVSRVELAPGQATGLHRHPCDVVGVILNGTVHFQVTGEDPRILTSGDAFHEPAGSTILHFDNASGTEPVSFLACYLLPPGEDRLIEMLDADHTP